jgi:hypothetical protein
VHHWQQLSYLITSISYRAFPLKCLYREVNGVWPENVRKILQVDCMNNNTYELLRHVTRGCTNAGRQFIRRTKFLAVHSMEFASSHLDGAWNFEVTSEVGTFVAPSAVSNNSWGRILLEKLTVVPMVKKFPPLCSIWSFITVFTNPNTEWLSEP